MRTDKSILDRRLFAGLLSGHHFEEPGEGTIPMNAIEPSEQVSKSVARESCPVGWQPCALRPVFWAFTDYGPSDGVPVPVRVFYPTVDGTPQDASMARGCGRYPVVVFLHGHCQSGEVDHYLQWEHLGIVLAKSGYLAVMPQIPDIASVLAGQPPLTTIDQLLTWIRGRWEHHDVLLPAPSTAVIGHSYGGLLAGRYASEVGSVAALATLHSSWEHDAPQLAGILETLAIPKLLVLGKKDAMSLVSERLWNSMPLPSHRATFENAGHWDYLPRSSTNCGTRSACSFYPAAAFTILDMFLSRYLPPEKATDLYDRIPDDLRPPTLQLTPEQEFFAGGNWLREIDLMAGDAECAVQLDQRVRATTFVPPVVGLNPLQAAQRVLDARLKPVVKGSGNKVVKQRPRGGRRAEVESEVELELGRQPIS
ncbi:PASTA domain-containing protein [Arthrobacter sp. ES3-54]|uniref:PASTA domain-containing protein n=1 Tax=Arthrobacter sp. ES3-54 TaxID=1502991 RepID=UPI002404AA7D|nr:PASTA domain-containing protein [Arthrobacter sp. ES3-54]MDF9750280.1 pimeloyl-ACP methyl ester carboxylesterase [Arthrobacter sp. ES3-54]